MNRPARVDVEWEAADPPHWAVRVTPSGDGPPGGSRPMAAYQDDRGAWWPMPDPSVRTPAGDSDSWDRSPAEFLALAGAVARRTADTGQAVAYGRHLCDALIGPAVWPTIDRAAGTDPLVVELGLPAGPLHRFVWELMHDGVEFLALRDPAPVVLPRIVDAGTDAPPTALTRAPKVLFAVGSALDDVRVRAGAEVMGVLRDVEHSSGGSVTARVVTGATLGKLTSTCRALRPDVVHLIAHGRWDAHSGVGRLTLGGEQADADHQHTAKELAPALGRPTLVVLSACDGAVAASDTGAPLAAELAARSKIPLVVAMAGSISDTACRVFTRALVAALVQGRPVVDALATGRRAAFARSGDGRPVLGSIDWALPAVFCRFPLDAELVLVDPDSLAAVRTFIGYHKHEGNPVFAGRHGLFDELDALLGPENPGALILHSSHPKRIGGTRALRELAAAAVRLGHLPVRIGPFRDAADAPTTLEQVAFRVAHQLVRIAEREKVPPPARTLRLLRGLDPDGAGPPSTAELDDLLDGGELAHLANRPLVREVRRDLWDLRDALVLARPGLFLADRSPLLLLDDAHLYGAELPRLMALLEGSGFGDEPGEAKLPVVLFGKASDSGEGELKKWSEKHESVRKFVELAHVTDLTNGGPHLAFLSWLLNPTDLDGWPNRTVAPRPAADATPAWVDVFGLHMKDKDFYDPAAHRDISAIGVKHGWFVEHDDNEIMRQIGMLR